MKDTSSNGRAWSRYLASYLGLSLVLAGLILFFGVMTDNFFSPVTFRTIANQAPEAILVAVGMTYVLIIGGIDLSVGSLLALSGAILGTALMQWGLNLPLAMGAALLTGGLCGAINGWVTVRWALPSFIVTLGMLEAARGGTYLATRSTTVYIGERVEHLSETGVAGLSFPFLTAMLVVGLAHLVLTRTVFGRYMVAIGSNEEATRLSGINPQPVKVAVFTLSGLLAGLASISNVSRLGSANPNIGIGFELNAIAAVVIGGTSLMGGRGSVICSLFGVLIIAVLETGLAQMGAQEPTKRLVTGCVIVAAVILDYYRSRLKGAALTNAGS